MRRTGPPRRRKALERGKPLAQGTPLARSGRVKPRRVKPRRGRLELGPRERQQLRQDVYDRAGGRCEAGVTPGCPGRLDRHGFEWHHRKLRSQLGDDVPENSLALCPACHEWVHRHPAESKRLGLIVPSWAHPADYALTLPDGRIVRVTRHNEYDLVFPSNIGDGAA